MDILVYEDHGKPVGGERARQVIDGADDPGAGAVDVTPLAGLVVPHRGELAIKHPGCQPHALGVQAIVAQLEGTHARAGVVRSPRLAGNVAEPGLNHPCPRAVDKAPEGLTGVVTPEGGKEGTAAVIATWA